VNRRAAAIGLPSLAALAVAVAVIATSGGSPYVVRAEFADANGLRADFAVRVQGVVVGRIDEVSVTPRDTALATLELDPSVAPIGAGASASIHPSNLLGETYVQLDTGDPRRPQPSGTTIPLARTSVTTELDQVLDAFNPDTRQAAAVFLAEQGNALLGRGQDLATLLTRLPSSLQSTQQLVAGLGQDNVALGTLVEQSDRILRAATPERDALGRLVDSARGALGTLASREQGLGDTISGAPGAVAQLRATLIDLQQAARPLGQAAAGLRASAPSLTQTLDALPGFTAAATPTLGAVTQAAPALQQLGTRATPVIRALEPAAGRLQSFSATLAPVSKVLDQNIAKILDVLQGWSRAIGDRDGIGHVYRIEALVPANVLSSLLGLSAVTPSPRPRRHHTVGGPATTASSTPASLGTQEPRPPRLPIPLPALPHAPSLPGTASTKPSSGGALGSLLHYLLGR